MTSYPHIILFTPHSFSSFFSSAFLLPYFLSSSQMWQLYIKKAGSVFGVTFTRSLFEKAITALSDKDAKVVCLEFAELERKVSFNYCICENMLVLVQRQIPYFLSSFFLSPPSVKGNDKVSSCNVTSFEKEKRKEAIVMALI
jgi:hypothetical protein